MHGESTFVLRTSGRFRCRRCAVEAVTRLRRQRRDRLIARAGGACDRCGYAAFSGALQFHHREPSVKLFDLTIAGMSRNWASLEAEAEKCNLLCANCHLALEDAKRRAAAELLGDRPGPRSRRCRRHGLQPHHHADRQIRCDVCRSERVIAWYRRRKRTLLSLRGDACSACQGRFADVCMQFHHLQPARKRFQLSGQGLYRPWSEVLAEAEACIVLCANCHAEHEWQPEGDAAE